MVILSTLVVVPPIFDDKKALAKAIDNVKNSLPVNENFKDLRESRFSYTFGMFFLSPLIGGSAGALLHYFFGLF